MIGLSTDRWLKSLGCWTCPGFFEVRFFEEDAQCAWHLDLPLLQINHGRPANLLQKRYNSMCIFQSLDSVQKCSLGEGRLGKIEKWTWEVGGGRFMFEDGLRLCWKKSWTSNKFEEIVLRDNAFSTKNNTVRVSLGSDEQPAPPQCAFVSTEVSQRHHRIHAKILRKEEFSGEVTSQKGKQTNLVNTFCNIAPTPTSCPNRKRGVHCQRKSLQRLQRTPITITPEMFG